MLGWNKSKKSGVSKKPAAPAGPKASHVAPSPQAGRPAPPPGRPQAAPSQRALSLPAMLLQQGKATREQLENALTIQKETGAFLGEILVEEGILDEKSLLSFLAKYCKIPHLSLLDYLIDDEVAGLVPKEICLKYRLIPIDKLGRNLTIAMVNPLNAEALRVVREHCPDLRIKPILCAYKHFETVTAKVFGKQARKDASAEPMSATAFGIRLSPAEKEAIARRRAEVEAQRATPPDPSAATPREAEEDIPDAIAVESRADFAEKKMSDSQQHKVRFAGEQAEDGVGEEDDTQSVFDHVFHQESSGEAPALSGEPDPDAPEKILEDVTNVMVESMRDTYEILARRMALFRGVDAENIAKIFARGMTVDYEAGDVIFKKGQVGESLYLILNGSVSIEEDGRQLALLGQGDMFGEMALVSEGARSADAIAQDAISLLALKMDVIHNIMPRDVSVQLLVNVILTLSQRLQEANAR